MLSDPQGHQLTLELSRRGGSSQVSCFGGSMSFSVFQVLLSQVHRLRALDLLGRFLDLGPWAVSLVRVFCLAWGKGS